MSDLYPLTVDQRFAIIRGDERRLAVQDARPYSRTLHVVVTRGNLAAMIENVDRTTLGILGLRRDLLDSLKDLDGDSVAFLDSITDQEYLRLVHGRVVGHSAIPDIDAEGGLQVSKYAGDFEQVLSWPQ